MRTDKLSRLHEVAKKKLVELEMALGNLSFEAQKFTDVEVSTTVLSGDGIAIMREDTNSGLSVGDFIKLVPNRGKIKDEDLDTYL